MYLQIFAYEKILIEFCICIEFSVILGNQTQMIASDLFRVFPQQMMDAILCYRNRIPVVLPLMKSYYENRTESAIEGNVLGYGLLKALNSGPIAVGYFNVIVWRGSSLERTLHE